MFCLLIVRNVQFKMLKRLKTYVQCMQAPSSVFAVLNLRLEEKIVFSFFVCKVLTEDAGVIDLGCGSGHVWCTSSTLNWRVVVIFLLCTHS
jgi:hypothetical protein